MVDEKITGIIIVSEILLVYILICLILFYVRFRSFKSGTPARKQARLDSNRMEVDEPEFNILKGNFFKPILSITNN